MAPVGTSLRTGVRGRPTRGPQHTCLRLTARAETLGFLSTTSQKAQCRRSYSNRRIRQRPSPQESTRCGPYPWATKGQCRQVCLVHCGSHVETEHHRAGTRGPTLSSAAGAPGGSQLGPEGEQASQLGGGRTRGQGRAVAGTGLCSAPRRERLAGD